MPTSFGACAQDTKRGNIMAGKKKKQIGLQKNNDCRNDFFLEPGFIYLTYSYENFPF
jgi:hypothetical protein